MPAAPTIVRIGDVATEAGAVITDAAIAYSSWGRLHTAGDGSTNVILVEHALTGDSDARSWWGDEIIGPGKPLDTDRFCVICTNVLGGCAGSTGPSSPHPDGRAFGSRFPAISIRDQVQAEKQFLDVLGIKQVAAVMGGSMGGARTLEWTLLYPDSVGAALVMAVSARASAWQIGIQTAQIHAVTRDPDWLDGDYHGTGSFPRAGLSDARKIAHLTYRGELEMDERFGAKPQEGEHPLGPVRRDDQRFAVESYLDYQADKLVMRFDAGSYVTLTEALNRHDIGRGRGGLNKALGSSTVPTMVAGVDTDILYPYHQQEHLARNLGALIGMAKISSPCGHDAFLTETRQVSNILGRFLRESGLAQRPFATG
ncbi:homoserine O-acetyltransferase [Corynebacterium mendelii]|uniref:Homoserine O-acetyltransferase n=1 Tax=Corynebacterium mendelii TaxID=2765362 RepID=A0A939E090_9CORY|nr:homoserine O-acetyltransferase [Corynebacterium mendelii]MBN9644081.1 homoserine O-acetyltransferase [Corynebacterium mendelii]